MKESKKNGIKAGFSVNEQEDRSKKLLQECIGENRRPFERKRGEKQFFDMRNKIHPGSEIEKSEGNLVYRKQNKMKSPDNESSLTVLETTGYTGSHTIKDFHRHLSQNSIIREEELMGKKLKQNFNDSANYYKYWKEKANEYQQRNFTLERQNSSLKEEIEILKHRNKQLENRLAKDYERPIQLQENSTARLKSPRSSNIQFYQQKIKQLRHQNQEQSQLIAKHKNMIERLSKELTENKKVKALLHNMEQRLSEKKSLHHDYSNEQNEEDEIGERKFLRVHSGYLIRKNNSINSNNSGSKDSQICLSEADYNFRPKA